MAEIDAYCDSDEEIFFGPVTEKEKKVAENLRRQALGNQGFCPPKSEEKCSDSQDGEEGLHTLAMAAQMLSLSSGDSSNCGEEWTISQAENCQPSEFIAVLPPVETITRGIAGTANDGSHLEMDAVKFLSRHLPDQSQCGIFLDSENSKNSFYDSSNVHFTSSASFADNGSEALSYWSSSNSTNMINVEQYQNITDEKMVDLTNGGTYSSDSNVVYPTETEQAVDTERKYGVLDTKVPGMNWEDVSEISKGEFGIKLSDNEEEIEKAQRNLKVEEIIKFLAEDENKCEVEVLKSSQEKLNAEIGLLDSKLPAFSTFDNANPYGSGLPPSIVDHSEPNDGCQSKGEIKYSVYPYILENVIPSEQVKSEKAEQEVSEVLDCERENGSIDSGVNYSVSLCQVKSEIASEEVKTRNMEQEVIAFTDCLRENGNKGGKINYSGFPHSFKNEIPLEEVNTENLEQEVSEKIDCKRENGSIGSEQISNASGREPSSETTMDMPKDENQSIILPHSAVKGEPTKIMVTGVSTPSDSMKKPLIGSSLKKPSSTYKRVPTPKVTPGMEKRPATPRPSRTPGTSTDTKHQRTPRPLVPLQSPALDSTSSKTCARPLLQGSTPKQEGGTPFKTPNAKPKSTIGSKIPHLQSAFSPSVIKSKKFAGIVSPVSQYIHNKPVMLIVNKKPSAVPIPVTQTGRADAENEPPKASMCATAQLQSLPDMVGERGAENVDATSYSTLPEVNFKSGLPVKIFSPIASPKTPKSGKTAIVTKHLGHIKISSSEVGKVPLAFECQESMMPEGEVSLLLSKEVELHTPTLLRN